MATEVLAILATEQPNAYRVIVRTDGQEGTFLATVDEALLPMLGVTADQAMYQLFGRDVGLYRPILDLVAQCHRGEVVPLPCTVERVLPAPRTQAAAPTHP